MDDRERGNISYGQPQAKLVSTVLELVLRGFDAGSSVSDDKAMDVWRRNGLMTYAAIGAARKKIVDDYLDESMRLKGNPEIDPLMIRFDELEKEWKALDKELTTYHKTPFRLHDAPEISDRAYSLGITGEGNTTECFAENLDTSLQHVRTEEENFLCNRISNFLARCWSVIFQSGAIKLDDQVAVPWIPDDAYTEKHLRDGIAARKGQL